MGNDALLSIIHESRMQLLSQWGYDELNAAGTALIMADVMIAYKGEAFYGDVLTIDIYAEEITTHSFDLLYLVRTERSGNTIDIAHAKTGMICYDYDERKIDEVTAELKKLLTQK